MVQDNADFASMQIDRANLEDYLLDSDFEAAFGMNKTQFLLKPLWRQTASKREAKLH